MPFGESAIIVEFGNTISPDINRKVHALHNEITNNRPVGVEECVPTYRSLLVTYDPAELSFEELASVVRDLEKKAEKTVSKTKSRKAVIPVVYGGDFGPDLSAVSQHHNLGERDVIEIHLKTEYTVYMIGFIAGFPYLGELSDQIATPRLQNPRLRVPAGSVGIAERQTGIYPREAPGGWRIIGRTPIKLFDPTWQPPALLQPGDLVKFKQIGTPEYEEISEAVSRGAYDPFIQDR